MYLSKTLFAISVLVIQLASSASVNTNSCACSREFRPVCASNNQSYFNHCAFECEKQHNANLEIRFYGECHEEDKIQAIEETACICPANYDPVCGSDDLDYPNECALKCEQRKKIGLQLKHRGKCDSSVQILNQAVPMDSITQQCSCPFIFSPICGSDGKTYSNECEIDCEKRINKQLEVRYSGECRDAAQILPISTDERLQCICPLIYMPVCGSNDQTYASECDLNCSRRQNVSLKVKHQGQCDSLPLEEAQNFPIFEEQCICPLLLFPVCGSDNQNYDNKCLLDCASKTKSNLNVKHYGNCN